MRAERDIRCHSMQGQQFESSPPAKLSDLLQQREKKVQECTGPSPAWQLLCQQLCDLQGKQVPLLWERLVQSPASQGEPMRDVQDMVAQQLDTSVQNHG